MAYKCGEYSADISQAKYSNMTNFTCVFKHEFEVTGTKSSSDIPESWSNPNLECSSYSIPTEATAALTLQQYPVIQSTCQGHKLPTGDLRGAEFEAIRDGKYINSNSFNNLVEILKNQINLRLESRKYTTVYTNDDVNSIFKNEIDIVPCSIVHQGKLKNNTTILSTATPGSVAKQNILKKLIKCISALQPNKKIKYTGIKYPAYDQRPAQTVVLNPPLSDNPEDLKPLISKSNMTAIIDVIKKDLNDCICYGDCNGYSVCFCYGNCNHY